MKSAEHMRNTNGLLLRSRPIQITTQLGIFSPGFTCDSPSGDGSGKAPSTGSAAWSCTKTGDASMHSDPHPLGDEFFKDKQNVGWPDPRDLQPELPSVPEFDLNNLPECL